MESTVLVIDDDEVTRTLLREVLEKEGLEVVLASSGEEASQIIRSRKFPVVLSDIRMLEMDGMSILRQVKKLQPSSAVILMTGFGSMEGAVEAIQEGAFDYVSKPFKMDDLKSIVHRAFRHWESLQQFRTVPDPLSADFSSRTLIGKSPRIVEVYKTLARAALSHSTVLITGESGTGKELVARAIHDNSPVRKCPFLAVNCGALSEGLLESELFGHVRGAFTGALFDKRGLIEEADGGTLFLDEVGDISAALQIKLLRVLQEHEVKPVGALVSKAVSVRVIAATHRELEAWVKVGRFREDLLYRLKVIPIHLPPLRERMEDLPDLVEHFLAKYARKNKKRISHVSQDAMRALSAYSWPGNIRELEHAIERAVALSNGPILFLEDFPAEIVRDVHVRREPTSLEQIERQHIVHVLKEVRFNKSKASEILGIDRATLYRKAQKYGIELKK